MFKWIVAVVCLALGCGGDGAPEPGPLEVGVATARMPVPVGIGTVGYGGFGFNEPSPFAELYPATRRVHGHPDFRAIAISRGEGFEAIFVRSDTVGIFQQLRQGVLAELKRRTGRDFDDALILGATHTHSGPGRLIDGGGPYDLIADRFFPEFYHRMEQAIADVVETALSDLQPARLGFGALDIEVGHSDRRCEDGLEYTNDDVPVMAVERNGTIDALMMSYAIHGTVLGIEELTLSQDVSGAIEMSTAQRFDHPVTVMMFNSWGADVAPGDPEGSEGPGAEMPKGYERMERVGQAVADELITVLDSLEWTDTPEIHLQTHRAGVSRELLEYEVGEFPYDYGGVYCGVNEELLDCDPETDLREEGLDQQCIPFPAEYPAPDRTVFTAGRIGPFAMVTFPGEPGTLLAEAVASEMRKNEGVGQILFLGYSQDYLGYSILEDDWWQGGYEASGALWGPRQGAYLADRAAEVFARSWVKDQEPSEEEPAPVNPFSTDGYVPYSPETPTSFGTVTQQPQAVYGADELVSVTVAGADPWLGTPLATLVAEDGQPVLFSNGTPVNSDTFAFWVELATEPTYKEQPESTERTFLWTVSIPAHRRVSGLVPELAGTYRLSIAVPGEEGVDTVVETHAFEITP